MTFQPVSTMSITADDQTIGLQRYQIKEKIGSGGMATVFLANDDLLGRDVALKMMHEHLMNSPETINRFSIEARTVALLSHENIVKVHDYGRSESRPYLVMEYIDGTPLSTLIERYGVLPNLVALEIARQIALGLCCAHGKGVFHRDIKPDNIMIDRSGVIKIMDFGIAYLVNRESLTLTGSFVGSPRFISPEQAEARPLTGTTDIFSLGVLLYHALSGNLPFDAETPAGTIHAIIHHSPPSILKTNLKVLFWLSDMVDVFLIKDPAARPDAQAALAYIEKECSVHGLAIGKERLKRFLDAPAQYAVNEYKELFEHYRALARHEAKEKRTASVLKKLEQAKVFGPLLDEDERIIKLCFRRRNMGRFLAALLVAVSIAGLGIVAHSLRHEKMASSIDSTAKMASMSSNPIPAKSSSDSIVAKPPMPARFAPALNKTTPARALGKKTSSLQTAYRTTAGAAPAASQTERQAQPHGFLSVKTNPPWVEVFIDEIERGTTPTAGIFQVSPGPHILKLVKKGFAEYARTLSVIDRDTLTIRARLMPLTGP